MVGPWLLSNYAVAFGEDGQLVARKIVLLNSLPNQLF
jgi:hypothetical protein